MPTDGTGQGGGGGANGLAADPRLLAGVAGGLVAACLALWAFRGLPLGGFALWTSPLPLFVSGIGFGTVAALLALVVAVLAIWLAGSSMGAWLFLLGYGVPAGLLIVASRGGLGLPTALLGLLPAIGILVASIWLSGTPGGLEGVLSAVTRAAMERFDLHGSGELLAELMPAKSAALGFSLALALIINAWLAGRLLARAGIATAPAWTTARLPAWYLAMPALAFGLWLAAEEGGEDLPFSLVLVLLVPLLLHGLAALHRRTRGRPARPMMLGVVYLALTFLFVPASLSVAAYGAFDLIRSSSSNRGSGRGTPPPRS